MTQVHVDSKIEDLLQHAAASREKAKQAAAQFMEQAKASEHAAKAAKHVKKLFPTAKYSVQPDGCVGYTDINVMANTPEAIKKHTKLSSGFFGSYYEVTTKLGKEKIVVTGETVEPLSNQLVCKILDADAAFQKRKLIAAKAVATKAAMKESE